MHSTSCKVRFPSSHCLCSLVKTMKNCSSIYGLSCFWGSAKKFDHLCFWYVCIRCTLMEQKYPNILTKKPTATRKGCIESLIRVRDLIYFDYQARLKYLGNCKHTSLEKHSLELCSLHYSCPCGSLNMKIVWHHFVCRVKSHCAEPHLRKCDIDKMWFWDIV